MLFTRCPDCDTTFRVTDDALKKANGQVRCGRCASVFNAYAEMRDAPAELADAPNTPDGTSPQGPEPGALSATPDAPTRSATITPAEPSTPLNALTSPSAPNGVAAPAEHEDRAGIETSSAPLPTETPAAAAPSEVLVAADTPPVPVAPPPQDSAVSPSLTPVVPLAVLTPPTVLRPAAPSDTFESVSIADVVAQIATGVAEENATTAAIELPPAGDDAKPDPDSSDDRDDRDDESISASEVQQVLEGEDVASDVVPAWPFDEPPARRRVGLWAACSGVAVAALALQSVHHFRADLARNETLGPIVQSTYALLGAPVVPRYDIRQYEILDWIATAEPNTRGQGSLRITARIKNRGPSYQPYPSVHLRLKDRWEAAVGSRVFAPKEYLAAAPSKMMAPGETARAQFDVVDPGQDAYGFELDVCIEIETRVLSCGSDKVFL